MKKGCLIALGVLVSLGVAAVIAIYVMASRWEARPKAPGEAEMMAVDGALNIYHDRAHFGSDDRSDELAKQYSLTLKLAREAFFTEGNPDGFSLSKGNFITYCSVQSGKCVFVVHVPELRRFAPEARDALGDLAWRLAVHTLRENKVDVTEVAIGVRGVLDYGRIVIGTFPPTGDPAKAKVRRYGILDRKELYPFFVGAKVPAERKP